MNNFFYKVNDIDYPVIITPKRIKNIHFRFIDGAFYVSCHPLTRKSNIIVGLDKFAKKLVEKGSKPASKGEDYIYLFGVKIPLESSGTITFNTGNKIIYKDQLDLEKKLKKFFLNTLKERVAYYSHIMGAPLYKVSVKNMKSRFGSNSKHTETLHFATILMHYSYDVIDSVIIHEIAHIFVYNHSKAFWDVVYKYCPDYDRLRKKLIRGEYQ